MFAISAAAGEETADECARPKVEKIEGPMVWRPDPGGDQIPLWPESVAVQAPETDGNSEWVGNGSPLVAGRTWNWATYVSRPTMTIYSPKDQNTHAAILVLPGGGYAAVAMDLEGTEICDWITEHGVTCVLLKYRVPQAWRRDENGVGQPPEALLPLQDAQRAVSLLRHRASSYGINPEKIGVIGFSAGGHLAAALSNAEGRSYDNVDAADEESSRPDFAILLYPGRLWHQGGSKTDMSLARWVAISASAPPTLLIHAMNDPVDDVRQSIAYGLALNDAGAPVDMRFFAKGCHAFGLRPTSDPITVEWPRLALKWLQNINIL
jgi:acetyl esterase/lipase